MSPPSRMKRFNLFEGIRSSVDQHNRFVDLRSARGTFMHVLKKQSKISI